MFLLRKVCHSGELWIQTIIITCVIIAAGCIDKKSSIPSAYHAHSERSVGTEERGEQSNDISDVIRVFLSAWGERDGKTLQRYWDSETPLREVHGGFESWPYDSTVFDIARVHNSAEALVVCVLLSTEYDGALLARMRFSLHMRGDKWSIGDVVTDKAIGMHVARLDGLSEEVDAVIRSKDFDPIVDNEGLSQAAAWAKKLFEYVEWREYDAARDHLNISKTIQAESVVRRRLGLGPETSLHQTGLVRAESHRDKTYVIWGRTLRYGSGELCIAAFRINLVKSDFSFYLDHFDWVGSAPLIADSDWRTELGVDDEHTVFPWDVGMGEKREK